MIHSFNTEIAAIHGIEEAVILNNLTFWIEKNAANGVNYHDGRYWTYNSVNAFGDLFPYMTKKRIYRALVSLENEGAILSGNYNEKGYDRTKWYALSDKFMLESLGALDFPKLENGTSQNGKCISQNGKMEFPVEENAFSQMGTPIPDSKPDDKPDMESILINQILDSYDEIVKPNCNVKGFIKSQFLNNKTRLKSLQARIREDGNHQTLDFWIAYFENCCKIPWIRDGIDGAATCTIDHLFNKTKFWRHVEEFWA
jgi:hypothetical protein